MWLLIHRKSCIRCSHLVVKKSKQCQLPWQNRKYNQSSIQLQSKSKRPVIEDSNLPQQPGHVPVANSNIKEPRLSTRWFYSSDIPKWKPSYLDLPSKSTSPQKREPLKFVPFSIPDSRLLEREYQKLVNSIASSRHKPTSKVIVPVLEDKLFEVDLLQRQIQPVYWDGPIFEVRRGTWFDGDDKPCNERLADKLEEGYQYMKPFLKENTELNVDSMKLIKDDNQTKSKKEIKQNLIYSLDISDDSSYVLYLSDGKSAYIIPKTLYDTIPKPLLEVFPDLVSLGAKKVTRSIPKSLINNKEVEDSKRKDEEDVDMSLMAKAQLEFTSALVGGSSSSEKKEVESEMEHDYNDDTSDSNEGRKIDHLVLCVHGIGQQLSSKIDTITFSHSINNLRKTMKNVYSDSKVLPNLINSSVILDDKNPKYDEDAVKELRNNHRVQVLPITWRHKMSFNPVNDHKQKKDDLPSLQDVTVNSIKPVRGIVGNVLLDILLYYEPEYRKEIKSVVISELNRLYWLFKEKNPSYDGDVSILAHSLGSTIVLDILSEQPSKPPDDINYEDIKTSDKYISFNVKNLFTIGSPNGAFKLMNKKTIGPRSESNPEIINDNILRPKVNNFYNIFHPSDPVSYRVEPLICSEMAKFEAESTPYVKKDINLQLSEIASIGADLTNKLAQVTDKFSDFVTNMPAFTKEYENFLGISTEFTAMIENKWKDKKANNAETKKLDQEIINSKTLDPKGKYVEIPENALKVLKACNRNGRVDYSLPRGYLDFSIITVLSSHVEYFEDENLTYFLLYELLKGDNQKPKSEASAKKGKLLMKEI